MPPCPPDFSRQRADSSNRENRVLARRSLEVRSDPNTLEKPEHKPFTDQTRWNRLRLLPGLDVPPPWRVPRPAGLEAVVQA